MRTFFIQILVISCFISCKKEPAADCELNMASVAGSYKITKFEFVSFNDGSVQDKTTLLTDCERSGIYHLNADGSANYNESASCAGGGLGTWSLSNNSFYISFSSGTGGRISPTSISGWNCTDLILITRFPSVNFNYQFTLTRQ